jgi:chemotaxis response regulator CheB
VKRKKVAQAKQKTSGASGIRNRKINSLRRMKKAKAGLCPIVGVGDSAGGFEAAMELLRYLPAKNGMAFVIVQHLEPHHGSQLSKLLGKTTAMPVIELAKTAWAATEHCLRSTTK